MNNTNSTVRSYVSLKESIAILAFFDEGKNLDKHGIHPWSLIVKFEKSGMMQAWSGTGRTNYQFEVIIEFVKSVEAVAAQDCELKKLLGI